MKNPQKLLFALAFVAAAGLATAKDRSGGNVAVQIGSGNTVANERGVIGGSSGGNLDGVEMTGSAVINGEVYIDGERIAPGVARVVSKKTGQAYRIRRDRQGNVSVTEESK